MTNQPIPTEEQEQVALAQWLDLHKINWFHVPNGGDRNLLVAKKLKAQGVKKGVPDIIIVDKPPANPCFSGVAIELKRRDGGKLGKDQKEWLATFARNDWYAEVCHGAGEAIELLENLGYGRRQG